MAPKSCRHASQALRLPDFRRALRHHDALGCELCSAPPVRGNSRIKTSSSAAKRGRGTPTSPVTPDAAASSDGANNAALTLKGWAPNPAWEDLYVCLTCGHMGCLGKNHLMLHFQLHPKHFVGFHVASKTFWCCPCKAEVDSTKAKIQNMMNECNDVFDEIAAKQQRRVKNKLITNPTLSPEEDDCLDSQRSWVYDDETSRGVNIADLEDVAEPAAPVVGPADEDDIQTPMERPRSITFGTDQSRALEKVQQIEDTEWARGKTTRAEQAPQKAVQADAAPAEVPPQVATAPSVLGFSNLGNTCYFNAATQALLTALHYFPTYIYEDEVITRMADSPVAATLMMLQGTIIKKTRHLPPLSPEAGKGPSVENGKKGRTGSKKPAYPVLTVAPLLREVRKKFGQFRGHYQQDAHELFTSLLWAIDEEIDPPKLPVQEDPIGDEDDQQQPELVNLFVKTDTGETISLRVSPTATKEEIQALLAKKLSLDDSELFLQPSGGRQTLSRRSADSKQAAPTFSQVNFVRTLFGGALITEVRCRSCANCSEIVEDAFQLSLPIPPATNGKLVSVKDCLEQFTVETQLLVKTENGYDCEKCSRPPKSAKTTAQATAVPPAAPPPPAHVLRDATMRLRISELPRVLVLHLKRLGRLKKITQHIQFEPMLDMAPHVDDDVLERHDSTLYELIAIVVHKGNKRAGHYVAYVSRKKVEALADDDEDVFTKTTRSTMWTLDDPDHDWFYISDSLVQSVPFEQVIKCEAYMLFYQQVAPSSPPSPVGSPRETVESVRETELLRVSELRISDDLGGSERDSEGDWI